MLSISFVACSMALAIYKLKARSAKVTATQGVTPSFKFGLHMGGCLALFYFVIFATMASALPLPQVGLDGATGDHVKAHQPDGPQLLESANIVGGSVAPVHHSGIDYPEAQGSDERRGLLASAHKKPFDPEVQGAKDTAEAPHKVFIDCNNAPTARECNNPAKSGGHPSCSPGSRDCGGSGSGGGGVANAEKSHPDNVTLINFEAAVDARTDGELKQATVAQASHNDAGSSKMPIDCNNAPTARECNNPAKSGGHPSCSPGSRDCGGSGSGGGSGNTTAGIARSQPSVSHAKLAPVVHNKINVTAATNKPTLTASLLGGGSASLGRRALAWLTGKQDVPTTQPLPVHQ